MRQLFHLALAIAAALVTTGSSAQAQCPTPDRLDGGPCCTAATPRIPQPPGFSQQSIGICWKDCDIESIVSCKAVWGGSSFTQSGLPCRVFRPSLRLLDGAGVTKWRGRMTLQYSRTWLETDGAGNDLQVWRYLANGNLRPTAAAGPAPCPVPPCAAQTNNRVRFTGYVDYVRVCGTNARQYAWMLTHACDAVDHAPGFPRGGAFHPDRSYTFVGPGASFAPSPSTSVAIGGAPIEAVRRVDSSGGVTTCEYEEGIDFVVNPVTQTCVCGGGLTPQWYIGNLLLGGFCGTSISTQGGPFLPGYMSMSIGSWIDPSTYPGLESLRYSAGGYDRVDSCAGTNQSEVYFGVTTVGGYAPTQILSTGLAGPLPATFIDQASSKRSGATIMNVPFRSDFVLNLNL